MPRRLRNSPGLMSKELAGEENGGADCQWQWAALDDERLRIDTTYGEIQDFIATPAFRSIEKVPGCF